jgi:hypothetical protein
MTTTLRELTQKLRTSSRPTPKGSLQFVDPLGQYSRTDVALPKGINPQSVAITDLYNTEVQGVGSVTIDGTAYPKGSAQAQAALDSYLAREPQPNTTVAVTSSTTTTDPLDTGGATLTQLIAGPAGPAARFTVGTVTMGPEGQVVISGSSPDLTIDFVLPTVQAVDTITTQTLTVTAQGTIARAPTAQTDITNKQYVDSRSLVMAVAFS